ncbi:thiol reductant ABC exporter subunit CydD [Roseibium sp.]|uniref:thiol reductant ABC exporter subunit CydD n=1 Tax=Roseibium sp. TaxID=1936156 RepID=UPI003BAAE560
MLRRAGLVQALADLLWVPQAGFLAWSLGAVLSQSAGSGTEGTPNQLAPVLLTAAAMVVLIAFVRVFLQYHAQDTARRAARQIQERARSALLHAAARRSPSESFPSSGAFAAHVVDQVDLLGPYYRNFMPQYMRLKLVPIGIVLVTAWFSWLAALILLVCGPVIPVFMALIGSRAKAASEDQQEELTRLSGMLLDRIRGLETLTVFGALDRTRADIHVAGERFRLGTMKVLKVAFLSSTVLELFSALGIAFSAVYVGFTLLGDLDIGTWGVPLGYAGGLFVLLLAPEFFAPLRAFSAAYHDRAAGIAASRKLSELLQDMQTGSRDTLKESGGIVESNAVQKARCLAGPPGILVSDLSIMLSGRPVFERFSLKVAPGETLLLTGRSGRGKSTLLDCVLGFRTPDDGQVLLNGTDVRVVAKDLQTNVMWLGQAPKLFHGSLKSNLLKGHPRADLVSPDEIWKTLHLAGAAELVERLPQGLSTRIGEDGFGLSVGEIRRIALARAALRTDAVLLIADEPTAGLDKETAADVVTGLGQLAKGRTTLVASHDAAVLDLPGRVLDLDSLETHALEPVT